MDVADSLIDLIGNTPLVRLARVGADLECDLLAKLEMLNPGGSVKDRPAVAMIDAAERERSTGPEIWRRTDGRVTHFVAGIGTGGTITGVARYLKSQNPDVQVIGADPEGSVFSGGSGRPYLVEGVGEDFWPLTFDPKVVDRTIMVTDAESFAAARRVTREEGIL